MPNTACTHPRLWQGVVTSQEAPYLVMLRLTSLGSSQGTTVPVHFSIVLRTSRLGNKHAPEMHPAAATQEVRHRLHPPAAWAARSGSPAGCGACARQIAPPHLRPQSSPPSQGWHCRSGGRTACQAPAGGAQQSGHVSLAAGPAERANQPARLLHTDSSSEDRPSSTCSRTVDGGASQADAGDQTRIEAEQPPG